MGNIIIQQHTTKDPISLIGYEAGICWGADIADREKNYKRGLDCLNCNHGRTLEFPQVYITLEGYSARVIREFYTHIGGAPTRLQSSTRYINYGNFDYIMPPNIKNNKNATDIYCNIMFQISEAFKDLSACGIANEDIANILPLGMTTKVVTRTNLRQILTMAEQRLCTRVYWEFRQLMLDLLKALSEYSSEWKYIVKNYVKCKCDILGYCPEKYSCLKYHQKLTK